MKPSEPVIPEVRFSVKSNLTAEERLKEKERLIKQRNEILISKGYKLDENGKIISKTEEIPRQIIRNEQGRMSNKVEDALLGFAIGDAMGVPIEFYERKILDRFPIKDMFGYGTHNVPVGTWSDDTSLTLATMDSIINNDLDFDDIMNKFLEWYEFSKYTATDMVFDIGNTTRKSIINYKNGLPALECGQKNSNSNGNGSLMRVMPFAFYIYKNNFSESEKIDLINKVSSLTHAHEISKFGCNIYIDYIILLLNGCNKNLAYEILRKKNYSQYYSDDIIKHYDRVLNGNLLDLEKEDIKSSGFIVDTLEASLWCTLKNDTFEDSIISAINLGLDTDTIGAITGSINGIIYGCQSFPSNWLAKLKKLEYLENISEKFNEVMQNKNVINDRKI